MKFSVTPLPIRVLVCWPSGHSELATMLSPMLANQAMPIRFDRRTAPARVVGCKVFVRGHLLGVTA